MVIIIWSLNHWCRDWCNRDHTCKSCPTGWSCHCNAVGVVRCWSGRGTGRSRSPGTPTRSGRCRRSSTPRHTPPRCCYRSWPPAWACRGSLEERLCVECRDLSGGLFSFVNLNDIPGFEEQTTKFPEAWLYTGSVKYRGTQYCHVIIRTCYYINSLPGVICWIEVANL